MKPTVYLVATHFWRRDGTTQDIGGAQRYCKDVADLLVSWGYPCVVIQQADLNFRKQLNERLSIIGVKGSSKILSQFWFSRTVKRYIEPGSPVIYINMQLAWPVTLHPCLTIQHGIWWDSDEMKTWEVRLQGWMIKQIVGRCDDMICVDTNFMNWFRATWPHTDISTKLSYIPNYVDPQLFHLAPPKTGHDDVVVVYPRRLCLRRGAITLVRSIEPILARCPNVKFHFIGDGELEMPLKDYIREHGLQNVAEVYPLPPDRMQEAYERADIVVIPTLAGEGTSLSCLEAMYCGRPVIATTVGGLPNLVFHGYSGLLIGPNEQELTAAVIRLASDPELRTHLAANARKVAEELTIDIWKERVGVKLRRLLDRVKE